MAGEPIGRVNEMLAPGERRQVQHAQPGYNVAIRRLVADIDGSVLADGDFVADCRPQLEAWKGAPRWSWRIAS
jgi:hypothetical protein